MAIKIVAALFPFPEFHTRMVPVGHPNWKYRDKRILGNEIHSSQVDTLQSHPTSFQQLSSHSQPYFITSPTSFLSSIHLGEENPMHHIILLLIMLYFKSWGFLHLSIMSFLRKGSLSYLTHLYTHLYRYLINACWLSDKCFSHKQQTFSKNKFDVVRQSLPRGTGFKNCYLHKVSPFSRMLQLKYPLLCAP